MSKAILYDATQCIDCKMCEKACAEQNHLLCSVLVVLEFVTNRLNVSITGMEAARVRYIPKWTEMAVTASIIAAGFAIFALAVKHLPIFPEAAQKEGELPVAAVPVGEERLGAA